MKNSKSANRTISALLLVLIFILQYTPLWADETPDEVPMAPPVSQIEADKVRGEVTVAQKMIVESDGNVRIDETIEMPPKLPDGSLAKDTADMNWVEQLRYHNFDINAPGIKYPKFLKFCLKVYNWGDHTFNSYDTAYVVGTGKKWKVRALADTWVDSYNLTTNKELPIWIISEPYNSAGAYIQWLAVSVGYSLDINSMVGKGQSKHSKLEYGFSCARFKVEGHYWNNTGGSYIRQFSDYNEGRLMKQFFDGVKLSSLSVSGYYFFNNRKFSIDAAYSYSRIQKKSAGTALVGIGYRNVDVGLDFTKLPDNLKPYLYLNTDACKFHYNSYLLIGGYSFNWVWNRHLLFNATAMPCVGFAHTYSDSTDGESYMVALAAKGTASITYNLRNFFVCAVGKMDANWYLSKNYKFLSSVENLQVSLGLRF